MAPDAVAFSPRFPLWTDGATKRRWLLLPEGGAVDTSDPERWAFPVGTRLFKEFTRDGVRIETRMNLRTEDGWAAAAYLWDADGEDARRRLQPVEDAAGTPHDVPGAAECLACHGGRGSFTLGFSATQLDPDTRAELFETGVLSDPVDARLALHAVQLEGLGTLHGNCSHCHNADRDDQPQATDCYRLEDNFDLTLPADLGDAAAAPAVQTARWLLGSTDDSEVLDRISTRNQAERDPSMPPLGTEEVDHAGVAAVRAFIAGLPPRQ